MISRFIILAYIAVKNSQWVPKKHFIAMNYEVLYSPEFVKALFLYIEIHFPQPNDSLRIGERFSGPNRGQDGYSVPVTTMNVAPVLWMSLKLKIWECQVGRVGCRGKFPW